mmetsp:Transcript_32092/g.55366  ORF Transcript_32092/g.55366 Transcript_32092/m.55366 type:complete len:324 (+) Transcript_32092:256-1227(+)
MPCGRWADKLEKTKWPVIIWSVLLNLTAVASGFAVNFWTLLIPRMVYAVCSAGIESIFLRLIGLYFPPSSRGYAAGIFFIAVYVGAAMSSLTLALSSAIGWRLTYIGVGAAGILNTIVVGIFWPEYQFTEDDRRAIENAKNHKVVRELWELIKSNKTLNLATMGTAIRYSAGFTRGFFDALYFTKQFSSQEVEYSLLAFAATALSVVGPLTGGYISDRKERASPKWRPIISSVTNFIAVPLYLTAYTTTNFALAMSCIFLAGMIGEAYISVSSAMTLNVSPPHMRALVAGWIGTVSYLLGAAITGLVGLFGENFVSPPPMVII